MHRCSLAKSRTFLDIKKFKASLKDDMPPQSSATIPCSVVCRNGSVMKYGEVDSPCQSIETFVTRKAEKRQCSFHRGLTQPVVVWSFSFHDLISLPVHSTNRKLPIISKMTIHSMVVSNERKRKARHGHNPINTSTVPTLARAIFCKLLLQPIRIR